MLNQKNKEGKNSKLTITRVYRILTNDLKKFLQNVHGKIINIV